MWKKQGQERWTAPSATQLFKEWLRAIVINFPGQTLGSFAGGPVLYFPSSLPPSFQSCTQVNPLRTLAMMLQDPGALHVRGREQKWVEETLEDLEDLVAKLGTWWKTKKIVQMVMGTYEQKTLAQKSRQMCEGERWGRARELESPLHDSLQEGCVWSSYRRETGGGGWVTLTGEWRGRGRSRKMTKDDNMYALASKLL